ncbi:hypothetical protein COV20_00090 [Candidatus Woesearchaeota archaeon CG10_big_fil_rev_8_21_14_0_10_45_16]|nr:MAG: hypothetical protein COV20_00090 [Candidatus Woesearchaeota archaeon CG10_big_fil_rev_8_21_14_0_10_45_16]
MSLLSIEELRERKDKLQHFFQNHKDIFEVYLFLSIGIVTAYLLMAAGLHYIGISIDSLFQEQLKVLGKAITVDQIQSFSANKLMHALSIFSINVGVSVFLFILSIFYGAGSIFLVVWNASIFAAFLIRTLEAVSRGVEHAVALLGVFSLYVIPELAGFLLAAMAGGVVSKAMITERFMSPEFKNVVGDAFILLLLSLALLLVAAFLESYAGVGLIQMLM